MPVRARSVAALALGTWLSGSELFAQAATRLFVAPTARSLRRGEGLVGTTEVVLPFCEYGLADRLSVLGMGIVLDGVAVGVMPKIQLYRGDRLQAAVGLAQLFAPGASGGVGFGVVTLGGPDFGVTAGYGYGFGVLADSEGPPSVVFVGVDKALGRHLRLIGEGYIGGQGLGMPDRTWMFGVRVSGHRLWADLGAVLPFYETGRGSVAPLLTIGVSF